MKQNKIGHYEYHDNHLLGQGSTGKVYAGIDTRNSKKVAVKAIQLKRMTNDILKFLLNNEKLALQQIKSPYVLRLYDIIEDANYCYIITQYYQNGSLADYIDIKRRIPERQAMEMLKKIAIGLKDIHAKNIIHRDMKSQNIMLRNQDPAIIDFGYCEHMFSIKPLSKYNVGSPAYMSPQAFLDSKYSFQSDIWALGVIFHEMLTSEVLDEITPMRQFFQKMVKRGSVKIHHQFSNQVMKILTAIFHVNPYKRVNIDQLIAIIDQCTGTFQNGNEIKCNIKRGNSQQIKHVPFILRNVDKQNILRMQSKDNLSFTQSPTKLMRFKKNISDEKNSVQISPVKQFSHRYYHEGEISGETNSPQIRRYPQIQSQRNINYEKTAIKLVSADPEHKKQAQYPTTRSIESYKVHRKFNHISNFFTGRKQQQQQQNSQQKINQKVVNEQRDRQTSLNILDNKYAHLKSYSQKKLNFSSFQNNSMDKNASNTQLGRNKNDKQGNNNQSSALSSRPQLMLLRNHIKYGDKYNSYQEK